MKLVYSGAHDAVEPADVPGVVAVRGKEVDIPDEVAKRLLEQDTWSEAKSPAEKKGDK